MGALFAGDERHAFHCHHREERVDHRRDGSGTVQAAAATVAEWDQRLPRTRSTVAGNAVRDVGVDVASPLAPLWWRSWLPPEDGSSPRVWRLTAPHLQLRNRCR